MKKNEKKCKKVKKITKKITKIEKREKVIRRRFYRRCRAERSQHWEIARLLYPAGSTPAAGEETEAEADRGCGHAECGRQTGPRGDGESLSIPRQALVRRSAQRTFFPWFAPAPAGGEDSGRGGEAGRQAGRGEGGRDGRTERETARERDGTEGCHKRPDGRQVCSVPVH